MTTAQRLAVRLSEVRQRLNELSGLDEPTDEQRAELGKLTAEYPAIETRHRAAIIAESETAEQRAAGDETGGAGRETGEGAELRRLQGTARLGRYLLAAAGGVAVDGAESELLDALEVRNHAGIQPGAVQVPWSVLLGPEPEPERRAATTTAAYDGPTMQRPILQRLFGPSLADLLGVRMDTVPAGQSEWPLITAGVAPAQRAEDAAAPAAVAWTVAPQALKPKRLTGQYSMTAEAAASVLDLEGALRRDLVDAVMAQVSDQLLTGDGTGASVTGFYSRLAAPTSNPANEAIYSDYAGAPAMAVDGLHADAEMQVSTLLGTDVYRHAAGVYQSGSGESATEAINRRCRTCRASVFVPEAPDSGSDQDVSKGNILHAGGPNGGMMRGDSIAAVWPTLAVIRDIYTQASKGETVLTYVLLWDAFTAFRADAYRRVAFKLA